MKPPLPAVPPPEDSISVEPLGSVPPEGPRPEAFEIIWLKNQPSPQKEVEPPSPARSDEPENPQRNCLYLLPPGKEYPLNWFGQTGVLIRFHQDVLLYEANEFFMDVYKLFTEQENFSLLFVEPPLGHTLDQVLQLLEEEYATERNVVLLRALLKVFLLKLIHHQSRQFMEQDFDQKRVYQFLQLLEQHFKREKSVAFYADQLNITSKRLNQILKKKTGHPEQRPSEAEGQRLSYLQASGQLRRSVRYLHR